MWRKIVNTESVSTFVQMYKLTQKINNAIVQIYKTEHKIIYKPITIYAR